MSPWTMQTTLPITRQGKTRLILLGVCGQDFYQEYGADEATIYARHALALGEADLLILSRVDRQAFWAAVLWVKDVVKALEEEDECGSEQSEHLHDEELISAWKEIQAGKKMSRAKLKELIPRSIRMHLKKCVSRCLPRMSMDSNRIDQLFGSLLTWIEWKSKTLEGA